MPHLHALLTSGDEPPTQTDIFDLLKASYEVSTQWGGVGGDSPATRGCALSHLIIPTCLQKFSSLRASDTEQMRFKQAESDPVLGGHSQEECGMWAWGLPLRPVCGAGRTLPCCLTTSVSIRMCGTRQGHGGERTWSFYSAPRWASGKPV